MDNPSKMQQFEKRSIMEGTADNMLAIHSTENAFQQLTPPPIFVQVHRDERTAITHGEVEFTLWVGPIPLHWIVMHEPGPTPHSFVDRMLQGPMAYWRHEHIFTDVEGGVELIDRIEYAHPKGWRGILTRILFNKLGLHGLFFYRHLRTRWLLRK